MALPFFIFVLTFLVTHLEIEPSGHSFAFVITAVVVKALYNLKMILLSSTFQQRLLYSQKHLDC